MPFNLDKCEVSNKDNKKKKKKEQPTVFESILYGITLQKTKLQSILESIYQTIFLGVNTFVRSQRKEIVPLTSKNKSE